MKRKVCCIMLACAMLPLLLTACGQPDGGETTLPTNLTAAFTTAADVDALRPMPTSPTTVASTVSNSSATVTSPSGSLVTPLPTVAPSVLDPQNSRKLPTAGVQHSYGVAKDGKAHDTSVNFQAFFESKQYKAVCLDTKTQEKVLYLTFDCGWENGNTAKILDTLREKKVPATFFATLHHIKSEPALITRMIGEGHIVGNHSCSHPNFSTIKRDKMAQEIVDMDNYLRTHFGYTAPFFRFPEGAYNESALDLVQSLGYTSVFWSCAYADWDVEDQKGKDFAFQTVTARLHPGAIILLHSVSSDNAAAMGDIIDWAHGQGYTFRALTELPK